MLRLHFVSAIASCLLLAGAASAGPEGLHEGEWEITTTMAIPGMPMQPPPVTRTQCLTKKDAVPKPDKNPEQCQITHKLDGNKVTWKVVCDRGPNNKAEGSGEITYSGDSMEGSAKMKISHPRAPNGVDATQTIKGRRLGDCKTK